LLNGTLNGTVNRKLNGRALARTSGASTDERRGREIQDDMRRGRGMRVCTKPTAPLAVAVGGDAAVVSGDVHPERRPGAGIGQASWLTTPTLVALLLTASARSAHASETLNLIPDYALFGLLQLGLIPDESGLGALWVMLIAFGLLVLPLNALIFQPIFRALDSRAERIQGRSTALRAPAARGGLDSRTLRVGRAGDARRSGSGASAGARPGARRAGRPDLPRPSWKRSDSSTGARGDLAQSLESARAGLRASADDLARAAAEQVLGRALS
jgi:hypothetical protein